MTTNLSNAEVDELVAKKFGGYGHIKKGEIRSYSVFINKLFKKNAKIQEEGLVINSKEKGSLFASVQSGVLLCHLINEIEPNTIPVKMINYGKNINVWKKNENLNLAINSAPGLGIKTIGVGPEVIRDNSIPIILGLMWQLIRKLATAKIDLKKTPGLVHLLKDGETMEMLLLLSPEELLLRWINFHLENNPAYDGKPIKNYGTDLNDGSAYIALINQIQPKELTPQFNMNLYKADSDARRKEVVNMAKRLDLEEYIEIEDMEDNDTKTNMIFCSMLFNEYPALAEAEEFVDPDGFEEKTYKNWINSLGLENVKTMMYFYPPLSNGINFCEIMEHLQPGTVNKKRVNSPEALAKRIGGAAKLRENCDYVVDCGQRMKNMEIHGISGEHIQNSHPKMTMAITWQLMRIHTLSIIKDILGDVPVTEIDAKIITWAKEKLAAGGKTSTFKSFQDESLGDAKVLLDLCDSIKPGSVKYEYVQEGNDQANVAYALAVCKMIGAQPYAIPFHLDAAGGTFDKKMVMTIFACLMKAEDLVNKQA
jgi:hypothetical protein